MGVGTVGILNLTRVPKIVLKPEPNTRKKTTFFGGFFGGSKPNTKNTGIKPEPNNESFSQQEEQCDP
jgi:hypothetical protein